MTHSYSVTGMTCSGCTSLVEKALRNVEGVESVKVDLQKATATISMHQHIPLEKLKVGLAKLPYQISEENSTEKHNHHPGNHDHKHEEPHHGRCN